jgi:hypothetical protein
VEQFDPSSQLYQKKVYGEDSIEEYHPTWLVPLLVGLFILDGKIVFSWKVY